MFNQLQTQLDKAGGNQLGLLMLSSQEIGYIAGFLDGEGCITIHFRSNGLLYCEISIVQNDIRPLLYIQKLIGGGIIKKRIRKGKLYPNPLYNLRIRQRTLIKSLLITLLPYLIVKRDKSQRLLTQLGISVSLP